MCLTVNIGGTVSRTNHSISFGLHNLSKTKERRMYKTVLVLLSTLIIGAGPGRDLGGSVEDKKSDAITQESHYSFAIVRRNNTATLHTGTNVIVWEVAVEDPLGLWDSNDPSRLRIPIGWSWVRVSLCVGVSQLEKGEHIVAFGQQNNAYYPGGPYVQIQEISGISNVGFGGELGSAVSTWTQALPGDSYRLTIEVTAGTLDLDAANTRFQVELRK